MQSYVARVNQSLGLAEPHKFVVKDVTSQKCARLCFLLATCDHTALSFKTPAFPLIMNYYERPFSCGITAPKVD